MLDELSCDLYIGPNAVASPSIKGHKVSQLHSQLDVTCILYAGVSWSIFANSFLE